jgi:phosphoglycerate dehydrogenase-like enzyme
MPAKALILAPFDDGYLSRLREVGVRLSYEPWTASGKLQNPSELAARLRDEAIEIIVVEADFLTAEAFAAPKLRLAAVCRNGLNLVDVNAATEHAIPIIFTPTRNTIAVAEHAIALMLSIARQSYAARDYVIAGEWTNPMDAYTRFQGRELNGSVIGVIGLGNIGGEVAKRALGFGAKVAGYDPFVGRERARGLSVRLAKLPALLRDADFVTLHTSLNAKEQILDAAALDLMKHTAYVINTGAHQALDYDALGERLRDGRLAGAALDVFPGFVLAPDSPLCGLDNVIVTPHIGGATKETIVRQSRTVFEDVQRYMRGSRPRNVANPEAFKTRRGR